MSLAERLIRPVLKQLVPYQSARRIGGSGEVWLNANENPYSREYQLDCSRFNRYPEFQPPEVIQAYADFSGLEPGQVLCTRGADEGIELLIRTFCEPGEDKVLICPPTYGMYAISSETNGVDCIKVTVDDDFQPNLSAIKAVADQVKLVFLCSPNNPTGHELDPARLDALLAFFAEQALVVVDEAYIEFSTRPSVASLLAKHDNLVVLRTLSKAFGLAGLRCGFTLASEEIIQALSKVIAPYPVPEPVAQIAAQALSEQGLATTREQVAELNSSRAHLAAAVSELGYQAMPSAGNYLLIRVADAGALMQAAAARGVILRDQSKQSRLQGCVRITIGSLQEMEKTLKVLAEFSSASCSASQNNQK